MNLWMVPAIAAGFVDLLLFVIVCNLWEENAALHKRWTALVAFIKGRSSHSSRVARRRLRLHAVANKLHQDCIAVLIGEHGRLIGDRAYKWG